MSEEYIKLLRHYRPPVLVGHSVHGGQPGRKVRHLREQGRQGYQVPIYIHTVYCRHIVYTLYIVDT